MWFYCFEDGSVSNFSTKTLPSINPSPQFLQNGNQLIKTYEADIAYTLNALEDFNNGNVEPKFLKGTLDLNKIGLFGHSTGGGADVLTAIYDKRVKSILGYDPWVEPLEEESVQVGLKIPTLFLRSDEWKNGPNNKHLLRLVNDNKAQITLCQVKGTNHSDFTLMYLFSPLTKKLNMLGKIDGDMLSILQGKLDVAFLNYTLKDHTKDELNKLIDEYPQIKYVQ